MPKGSNPQGNNQYLKVIDGKKFCNGCQKWVELSGYTPNKEYKTGVESKCRECRNKMFRRLRQQNPEKYREASKKHNKKRSKDPKYTQWVSNRNYKQKYGLSLDEVNKLIQDKSNKCDVCGMSGDLVRYGRLKIDHNHTTGNIRGLLCDKCNLALGLLNDSPQLIEELLKYIKKNS